MDYLSVQKIQILSYISNISFTLKQYINYIDNGSLKRFNSFSCNITVQFDIKLPRLITYIEFSIIVNTQILIEKLFPVDRGKFGI